MTQTKNFTVNDFETKKWNQYPFPLLIYAKKGPDRIQPSIVNLLFFSRHPFPVTHIRLFHPLIDITRPSQSHNPISISLRMGIWSILNRILPRKLLLGLLRKYTLFSLGLHKWILEISWPKNLKKSREREVWWQCILLGSSLTCSFVPLQCLFFAKAS